MNNLSPLQQDSVHRLILYQLSRDEAKKQGKPAHMRKWAKALEEERKLLEMITRVEAFNAADEQERSTSQSSPSRQSGTPGTHPERAMR